ncbi:MAG: DNA adenine methylase [Gaiellaceae bacterium]
MGSKNRLLPWMREVLSELEFESALDAFSGSGCVAYMLKAMGKRVWANDFLRFATDLAEATVVNSGCLLTEDDVDRLLTFAPDRRRFIETQFRGIFYSDRDNVFLDQVCARLLELPPAKHALARAALYRSCLKRIPRGVFTVAGLDRSSDGRRDLRLSLQEHFLESVDVFNDLVFDNGEDHRATNADVFSLDPSGIDLVYLDPPYVPRADDNCYIKRYHFLEGLSTYWSGAEFHPSSKVRKLKKRYTPFSYRAEAAAALEGLFERFAGATIVLSYSSNGYPDLEDILEILQRYKSRIAVHEKDHRYHFGTHSAVRRAVAIEYLIVADT